MPANGGTDTLLAMVSVPAYLAANNTFVAPALTRCQ